LLGLLAQGLLEPPWDLLNWSFGGVSVTLEPYKAAVVIYGIAFVLLAWAFFVNEFVFPSTAQPQPKIDPQSFRRISFMIAIALAMVAFLQFGENQSGEHLFTDINVTFWLAAIGFFVYGLWLRDPEKPPVWGSISSFLKRDTWEFKLTRRALLLLAIAALILFFRFYRLDEVPSEPFSDHAEKLLDVYDLTQGKTYVFFERNTGREFIQFYLTALVAQWFGTGLSFISLKIGTVLIGLFALPYTYLLGKEIGGPRVAVFALILAGTAYWLNTISRIGLRFPLYPAFAAPVLYHLVRGLRTQNRNDFILSGLFLGLGLHGYSPFRLVPFVVVLAVGIYLIHAASKGVRRQTLLLFVMLVLASVLVFLPLMRYAIDRPDMFTYRTLTRLSGDNLPEATFQAFLQNLFAQPSDPSTPGPMWKIFFENFYKAMFMFNYDDGEIWVHSVPHRPALDLISAVLFVFGYVLLFVRYLWRRDWLDLFLLLAVPALLMPSILSLAFPAENPSLNRTGGAGIVVFVVAAMALDGLYNALRGVHSGDTANSSRVRQGFALVVVLSLLLVSARQNYYLVFDKFATQFTLGAWNTSDMGKIIRAFVAEGNPVENAWVVPYPYWVDTRLVGIQSSYPTRDAALWRDELPRSLEVTGNKLFIVKDEDIESLNVLREMYPAGALGKLTSPIEGKSFWIYTVSDTQPIPTTP
jgi:hypothetical protein